MKKIKLEERFEKAVNAFFESDNAAEFNSLTIQNDNSIVEINAEKLDDWIRLGKKIFLFLPGAFILFMATIGAVYFYDIFGINLWTLFWFASGAFLVWAGMGDLKNKKHLALPASMIVFWTVISIIFSFLPSPLHPTIFFEYSIYLFPVSLIIPHLVKNWLEETE